MIQARYQGKIAAKSQDLSEEQVAALVSATEGLSGVSAEGLKNGVIEIDVTLDEKEFFAQYGAGGTFFSLLESDLAEELVFNGELIATIKVDERVELGRFTVTDNAHQLYEAELEAGHVVATEDGYAITETQVRWVPSFI